MEGERKGKAFVIISARQWPKECELCGIDRTLFNPYSCSMLHLPSAEAKEAQSYADIFFGMRAARGMENTFVEGKRRGQVIGTIETTASGTRTRILIGWL